MNKEERTSDMYKMADVLEFVESKKKRFQELKARNESSTAFRGLVNEEASELKLLTFFIDELRRVTVS